MAHEIVVAVFWLHLRTEPEVTKQRRICFIDDDEDELTRTKRVLSSHFTIGAGKNLDDALWKLSRKPHLFLLDMYYGPKTQPADRVRVAEAWQLLCQEQRKFYDLLRSLGQSPGGGLDLAEHVKEKYPGVPIVFFTRKGSLEDANEAIKQGAAAVLKKPDYVGEKLDATGVKNALDSAMATHQDQLVRSFCRIIDRNRWWARHARLRGFLEGVVASIIATLLMDLLMKLI
jgi:DNA-binding NtrC family response regulator